MEAGTLQDTEMQSLMKENHLTIYIDYETHQLREPSCQTGTCHAQVHSQSNKSRSSTYKIPLKEYRNI